MSDLDGVFDKLRELSRFIVGSDDPYWSYYGGYVKHVNNIVDIPISREHTFVCGRLRLHYNNRDIDVSEELQCVNMLSKHTVLNQAFLHYVSYTKWGFRSSYE